MKTLCLNKIAARCHERAHLLRHAADRYEVAEKYVEKLRVHGREKGTYGETSDGIGEKEAREYETFMKEKEQKGSKNRFVPNCCQIGCRRTIHNLSENK